MFDFELKSLAEAVSLDNPEASYNTYNNITVYMEHLRHYFKWIQMDTNTQDGIYKWIQTSRIEQNRVQRIQVKRRLWSMEQTSPGEL